MERVFLFWRGAAERLELCSIFRDLFCSSLVIFSIIRANSFTHWTEEPWGPGWHLLVVWGSVEAWARSHGRRACFVRQCLMVWGGAFLSSEGWPMEPPPPMLSHFLLNILKVAVSRNLSRNQTGWLPHGSYSVLDSSAQLRCVLAQQVPKQGWAVPGLGTHQCPKQNSLPRGDCSHGRRETAGPE